MDVKLSDNSCILVISDSQAPHHHPDTISFYKEVKKQFKPTRVIHIGDLGDFEGINFHGKNPNLPSAHDELQHLRSFVKELAKVFPEMEIVDSNHDALPLRKARSVGIPDDMIKNIGAIMEAPSTWIFVKQIVTRLPNGIICKFKHNFGSNLLADSMKQGMSLVCGHFHTKSFVQWWQNDLGMLFAMQVGCTIDVDSAAFNYDKDNALRPVISAGIIKGGVPMIIPMYIKKKKWKGYI
jgi:hypothetical protein